MFIPVLKTILPYLNGILMALNAIGEFILGLFGINAKKLASEFGIATINTGIEDIGNNAISSGKEVDKLYGKLRSFDKLNVITTPTDNSSGSGLGGLGGVDSALLNSMKEYNKQLTDVKNKAKEVRDAILGWLGFTIDENGEIKGFSITLGSIIGALVVGGVLWKGVKAIVGLFQGLGTLLGGTGLVGKGIKGISSALKGTGGVSKSANTFTVPKISTVLKGLADIALIVAGLGAIVVAIGGLMQIPGAKWLMGEGLNTVKDLFTSLGSVAIQIGAFSALIVGFGLVSPLTVLSGLAGLALIIGGLEGIIIALGWVFQNETVKKLHSNGKQILFDIAETIGGFAGRIISSFTNVAFEGLDAIGTHLSNFMKNGEYFFKTLGDMNTSTLENAKAIAGAVLVFTATNLLNGIANFFSFFTGQKMSLEAFGLELEKFAPHVVNYYEQVKNINGDIVEKSANAAKALAEFADKIPRQKGVLQWLLGEKNLSKFGEDLVPFGKSFKQYYIEVQNINGDVVKKSADAAQSLAELANKIPARNGVLQWLLGEKNLSQFGQELETFGAYYSSYYWKVNNINSDVVQKTGDAAQSLAELANKVPKSNGVLQWLLGEKNLAKFGEQLEWFGAYFSSYYWKINSIEMDKLNKVSDAIKNIVDIGKSIKDNNLGNTWAIFGQSLTIASVGLTNFFNQSNANDLGYSFGRDISAAIAKGMKNYKFPKLEVKDGWNVIGSYQVSMKADGGFLDAGEMFVARENGIPEFVGRIGSKTAVANNDQIVDSIAKGLAMSGIGKEQNINIIAKGDTAGFMDFITFETQKRQRQYGL